LKVNKKRRHLSDAFVNQAAHRCARSPFTNLSTSCQLFFLFCFFCSRLYKTRCIKWCNVF